MISPKLFNNLSNEQKVDFFIDCQKLLIKYHSNSEFVIRENNLNIAIDTFINQINKYKGYYYNDENVYLLWNHILISDPDSPEEELVKNGYKVPNPEYNAVSIDFIACRKFSDVYNFIKNYNEDKIKYLLMVRNNKSKIFNKETLIKNINFS